MLDRDIEAHGAQNHLKSVCADNGDVDVVFDDDDDDDYDDDYDDDADADDDDGDDGDADDDDVDADDDDDDDDDDADDDVDNMLLKTIVISMDFTSTNPCHECVWQKM